MSHNNHQIQRGGPRRSSQANQAASVGAGRQNRQFHSVRVKTGGETLQFPRVGRECSIQPITLEPNDSVDRGFPDASQDRTTNDPLPIRRGLSNKNRFWSSHYNLPFVPDSKQFPSRPNPRPLPNCRGMLSHPNRTSRRPFQPENSPRDGNAAHNGTHRDNRFHNQPPGSIHTPRNDGSVCRHSGSDISNAPRRCDQENRQGKEHGRLRPGQPGRIRFRVRPGFAPRQHIPQPTLVRILANIRNIPDRRHSRDKTVARTRQSRRDQTSSQDSQNRGKTTSHSTSLDGSDNHSWHVLPPSQSIQRGKLYSHRRDCNISRSTRRTIRGRSNNLRPHLRQAWANKNHGLGSNWRTRLPRSLRMVVP